MAYYRDLAAIWHADDAILPGITHHYGITYAIDSIGYERQAVSGVVLVNNRAPQPHCQGFRNCTLPYARMTFEQYQKPVKWRDCIPWPSWRHLLYQGLAAASCSQHFDSKMGICRQP